MSICKITILRQLFFLLTVMILVTLYMKDYHFLQNVKTNGSWFNIHSKNPQGIRICSQLERRQNLQHVCNSREFPGADGKISLILDAKRKVAYCPYQKSGCSTMRVVMANISSGGNLTGRINNHIHSKTFLSKHGLEMVTFDNAEVAKKDLPNFTKFIVVRHPYKRTLSGYYDKMRGSKFTKLQQKIIESYRENVTFTNDEDLEHPVLSEFLEFILSNDQGSKDSHWKPYHQTCGICTIDYDYIIKLETFSHDIGLLLSKVYKLSNYLTYDNMKVNSQEAKQYLKVLGAAQAFDPNVQLKEFSSIDRTLLQSYMYDFDASLSLFGYSYDRHSFTGTCRNANNCC